MNIRISQHIIDRCSGRLAGIVTAEEIKSAVADLTPLPGQTWVRVKKLAERVRIQEDSGTITGDVVWVVCRDDTATTVFIRRENQTVYADRVVG